MDVTKGEDLAAAARKGFEGGVQYLDRFSGHSLFGGVEAGSGTGFEFGRVKRAHPVCATNAEIGGEMTGCDEKEGPRLFDMAALKCREGLDVSVLSDVLGVLGSAEEAGEVTAEGLEGLFVEGAEIGRRCRGRSWRADGRGRLRGCGGGVHGIRLRSRAPIGSVGDVVHSKMNSQYCRYAKTAVALWPL
jgi:hypothetical protein